MTSVPTYVWMSQFHGCRLERNVGVKIIGKFRAEAAAELRKMNQKAVASRKKHNEKRKRQEEVFSDDDAVNHFSMEKTKLWNNSTCKMNIAPKVPTSAERIHDEVKGLRITTGPDGEEDWTWETTPPTDKKFKTNNSGARQVSHSPLEQTLSLNMDDIDFSSSDEE